MRNLEGILPQIISDLGLNVPYVKGQIIHVKNCWHFCTDGNAVDILFYDEQDFRDAMNRIYVVQKKYNVIILAFCLMDTHIHFVLYGEFDECKRFMHDFVARTSQYISIHHGDTKKMDGVPINCQKIDTDRYLKTAICYVVKNPPVGGLPFMAWNYPWSSGPLYFQRGISWTKAPDRRNKADFSIRDLRSILKSKIRIDEAPAMFDGLVLPEEYVAAELVESIFGTPKSYNFFLCITREEDVESRKGTISRLSVPMQEMRQHKKELCQSMFGVDTVKSLKTEQRIRLAKALRRQYNSSIKQIARLCGLVYTESKDLID